MANINVERIIGYRADWQAFHATKQCLPEGFNKASAKPITALDFFKSSRHSTCYTCGKTIAAGRSKNSK